MPTNVEVNHRGKIEDLSVDTALGYSNGLGRAIRIPTAVKRAAREFLRLGSSNLTPHPARE